MSAVVTGETSGLVYLMRPRKFCKIDSFDTWTTRSMMYPAPHGFRPTMTTKRSSEKTSQHMAGDRTLTIEDNAADAVPTAHDEESADSNLPSPQTAEQNQGEAWNAPRSNIGRVAACFWSLLMLGFFDAAYGVCDRASVFIESDPNIANDEVPRPSFPMCVTVLPPYIPLLGVKPILQNPYVPKKDLIDYCLLLS